MSINVEGNAIVKVDGQQAGGQLEELSEKARKLGQEYIKLSKQKLGNSPEAKKIKKEFDQIEKKIIDVSKKTEDYNKILKNLSGSSIRDLTKLHSHLNFQIKQYGRNTPEYKKAVVELQKVKAEMAKVRQEMNKAIPKTNRFGLSLKTIGANLAGAFGITAGIGMLVGALNSFIQKAKVVNELNEKIKNTFDLEGKAARNLSSDILALSTTFEVDYNQVLQTANTVSKEMGISAKESLAFIEQGFKKGSDNTGEFLDILKEYPTQFREAGIDAKTMFAIINQQVKEGIYSDKGVDAIKESGLRLRENTKAVQDALKPLDDSIKAQIEQEIAAGNSFAAIQLVSEALKDTSLTAGETQAIIADVFGGAGEDAGLRYLQLLSDIDTNLENVANQTSTYKESTLELSKQYNKFTLSATEGNGFISESLAWVLDGATDVLTALTRFNDGSWSDKLKVLLNAQITQLKGMLMPLLGVIELITGKELKFNIDDNIGKSLKKLETANWKVRKTAEELAEAQKENIKLTEEEEAALKKKQEAAQRAHAKALKEQERESKRFAAKEKAELQKIYDFIEKKETELSNLDPFAKKIAGIDKFYDDLIESAQKNSASEEEIVQLNKFREEEINRFKIESALKTEQAVFDLKKKYGLLTDEEIYNAEIEAFKRIASEKLFTEAETQEGIKNIRDKYETEKPEKDEPIDTYVPLSIEKIEKTLEAELEVFENSEERKTMTIKAQEAARAAIIEKYRALYQKSLEKKADLIKSFAEQTGKIMGDAMADNNVTAKDAMKSFLLMTLDMLKRQVQLMIGSIIVKELGTKGLLGIGTAAILTGLVEAAYGVAKGAVNGFSSGGYTGSGQRQEVAGVVHKDEYVIPSNMMADSKIQNIVGALENVRTGGSLDYSGINKAISKGFAEGGYTGAPSDSSGLLNLESANRLSGAIESLIDKGVPAYVKDNTISDMRKRFAVHEEIERNSSL